MGSALSACHQDTYAKYEHEAVPHNRDYSVDFEGTAYVVITGCDYSTPQCKALQWGPIDQYKSAQFMEQIVKASPHVGYYRTLFQEQMTRANVLSAIEEVGGMCQPGDCFVFSYAGHGDHLQDQDGDEDDAEDEALVCMNPATMSPEPRTGEIWIRDDELTEKITSVCPHGTRVLMLADCCHSGNMMDLNRPSWDGYECVSISGCLDSQVSKGEGRGSYFSHSLSAAYEQLQKSGRMDGYMASEVFNNMLNQFNFRYSRKSDQVLTIHVRGTTADQFPWPLVPSVSVVGEGGTGGAINYDAPID